MLLPASAADDEGGCCFLPFLRYIEERENVRRMVSRRYLCIAINTVLSDTYSFLCVVDSHLLFHLNPRAFFYWKASKRARAIDK